MFYKDNKMNSLIVALKAPLFNSPFTRDRDGVISIVNKYLCLQNSIFFKTYAISVLDRK